MTQTTLLGQSALINKDSFKEHIFVLVKKFPVRNIYGHEYPVQFPLPNIDNIFYVPPGKTRAEGFNRQIRYVPGEASVFVDEQQTKDLHSDTAKRLRVHQVLFKHGLLIIPPTEKTLLQFVLLTNWNKDNPYRMPDKEIIYKLRDAEADARKAMEKENALIDAKYIIKNMEFEDLLAFAYVLRLPVQKMGTEQMRHELMVRANKNPEMFMHGFNSPKMKRKYHILKAIDRGILRLNAAANSIWWADGGMIVQAGIGQDPIDFLTEHTFLPTGAIVYDQMKERLGIAKEPVMTATDETKVPEASIVTTTVHFVKPYTPEGNIIDEKAFIELVIAQSIVLQKSTWYKFTDTQNELRSMQKKEFVDTLNENPDLVKLFISKMQH